MDLLFHDWIGGLHLFASVVALASGTQVLWMKKGTRMHRQIGYVYSASMLGVIITAFSIYRLFGGFGLFHILAIVSFATLLSGMLPLMLKQPINRYISLHFSFMYWSVIGLYAAFVSEMLTRIPESPFFGMVGLATFAVMIVAHLFFYKYRRKWQKAFASQAEDEKKLIHH
jgi:uncharacterized membrane protein